MTGEPTTSTAAGLAGWKLIGGAAGAAGLASLVVMLMTQPRSAREWTVALITTVLGSVCGGAALVQYLGLQSWTHSYTGAVALIGVCFACGLPAWAVTRWCFTWMARREGKDIGQVLSDVRRDIAGG